MSGQQEALNTPFRVERLLKKWDDEVIYDESGTEIMRRERDPRTEPPTETMTAVFWFHPDGSEITDPVEIERQEVALRAQQETET